MEIEKILRYSDIIGSPCSINSIPISRKYDRLTETITTDDELLFQLPEEEQLQVINWIRTRLYRQKSFNFQHTSYGINHYLQSEIGIYLTNNQFKHAMMICGYLPKNKTDLNWIYQVAENSPCFKHRVIQFQSLPYVVNKNEQGYNCEWISEQERGYND